MPVKKKKSVKKHHNSKKKSVKKTKHAKKKKPLPKKKAKKPAHVKKKRAKNFSKSKQTKKSKTIKHTKIKKSKAFLKANLLITHNPTHTGTAKEELTSIFSKINEEFEVLPTEVQGLFEVKVDDARTVIKKTSDLFRDKPHIFRATFHWSPVDSWCRSDIKSMQSEIKKLVPGIKAGERWKMELNKRDYPTHFNELIISLTEPVERNNVDLESPQKIIRVEIISDKAGISLIKPGEALNLPKLKKESSC